MRARTFHGARDMDLGFDLTPMIDVMLFVFLFFIVSTQFVQAGRSAMDLPKEPGAGSTSEPDEIAINLDESGRLSLASDTAHLSPEALVQRLSAIARERGVEPERLSLLVRAHRNCNAGYLNRLAIKLAESGLRRWRLATAGGAS
ncbi:MAG: biopolymer transporter ExbD [Planctomycetota bacterium]|nr:biopolymer transporter ExbD [Planctomycetota bacterium]